MQGWVKLHRSLADNELWFAEAFTYGQAWVDLLIHANHKSRTIFIRNVEIDLDRGQLGWSEVTMSKRWKWSRGKVRRYLGMLEKRGMIVQHKTQVTSIVSICNYSSYQGNEQQIEQPTGQQAGHQTDNSLTPDGTQRKNGKNGENGKEEDLSSNDDLFAGSEKQSGPAPTPHKQIIELYHEILPELPRVVEATWPGSVREKNLASRWKQIKAHQNLDFWSAFFEGVKRSSFHLGENDRGWKANLGWLVERKNFDKMIERIENEGL